MIVDELDKVSLIWPVTLSVEEALINNSLLEKLPINLYDRLPSCWPL